MSPENPRLASSGLPRVERPQVALYGREGCHLCDEAREALLGLWQEGERFELVEIDIDSDDELHKRMLERIPVVEVMGVAVSELVFDPDAVRAALASFQA